MKIKKILNLWTSQFFKSLQFLYIVLMIAVISQDKFKPFNSIVELLLFVTMMLVVSIICGASYMYFYNNYMNYRLKEEMQTGNFLEPDDIGNQ